MSDKKSKGMNPVVKGGLACCAVLGLLIAVFCIGSGVWASTWYSVDPTTSATRYTETVGTAPPASVRGIFSVDMSPMSFMNVAIAANPKPEKLTLVAVDVIAQQGGPISEQELAWTNIVGALAPSLQQQGVSLWTVEAMSISDTGEAEDKDFEVDGKTFKAVVTPCKHSNGTELKRIYVKLKNLSPTTNTGLFAIGATSDFDDEAFEEALKGCTPR